MTLGSSVVTANESAQNASDSRSSAKVIYADEHGRILEKSPTSHMIVGARSRADYDFLMEKREELVFDAGGDDVSTATHSDSGSATTSGTWFNNPDYDYQIDSEFWAQADNGDAAVSGSCAPVWWGDAYWVEDPLEVEEMTIKVEVTAFVENLSSLSISIPPGYQYEKTTDSAILKDTFTSTSTPSLAYEEGAINFSVGNCYHKIEQHSSVKYKFANGNTRYDGHTIVADVGHCGDWV